MLNIAIFNFVNYIYCINRIIQAQWWNVVFIYSFVWLISWWWMFTLLYWTNFLKRIILIKTVTWIFKFSNIFFHNNSEEKKNNTARPKKKSRFFQIFTIEYLLFNFLRHAARLQKHHCKYFPSIILKDAEFLRQILTSFRIIPT